MKHTKSLHPLSSSKGFPSSTRKDYKKAIDFQIDSKTIGNKSSNVLDTVNPNDTNRNDFQKKVAGMTAQLHNTILSINSQTKKNFTLQQLITVLKGQMSNLRTMERKEEQQEYSSFEKKIKKIQYDIKQILHKHNEQIAKINSLKELAAGSRSERVVFSNLFKKIEKQIKFYEQKYKEGLIKNEIYLGNKRKEGRACQNDQKIMEQDVEQDGVQLIKHQSSIVQKNEHIRSTNQKRSIAPPINSEHAAAFPLTSTNIPNKLCRYSSNSQFSISPCLPSAPHSHLNKNLLSSIVLIESHINRLITLSGCRSTQEILAHYGKLQEENANIRMEVLQMEEQIEHKQKQIAQLQAYKRNSQSYEGGRLNEYLSKSGVKLRSMKVITSESEDVGSYPDVQNQQIVSKLLSLLQINQNNKIKGQDNFNIKENTSIDIRSPSAPSSAALIESNANPSLECLKLLDLKLSYLFPAEQTSRIRSAQSPTKMFPVDEMHTSNDRQVGQILDRADKFVECEKIYDRNMFCNEYAKEINKGRSLGKAKKAK